MKETTTTIVTTEVTRRAPRKKTIAGTEHIVSDGRVYIAEHHIPGNWPGEGKGIVRVDTRTASKSLRRGLTNSLGQGEIPGEVNLATSLFHLSAIRNGLCSLTKEAGQALLDKDDRERLQIIAVQLNEFIPIIRDIMTRSLTQFAQFKYPAL